ncbi:MAG: hypothetical protein HYU85_03510 [Chloroflexi bacterium]|nr:hypothetical protein [Chloroflexota bacterium]MBI3040945.1 hypothetical protein [Chloroflexota bacterium]
MVKIKTFTSEIKIFHTKQELNQLDEQVNRFISEQGIKKVISVSDACTTDDRGATIGIIRTLAYEES